MGGPCDVEPVKDGEQGREDVVGMVVRNEAEALGSASHVRVPQ